MRFFISLCLTLLALPTLALAQASKADGRLTEAALRDFYNLSLTIHKKPFADYEAFMKSHMSDDVEIKMNSIALVDGAPPQTDVVTMDKPKVMAALKDDYDNSQDAVMDQKINKIDITPDGKSAVVKTVVVITKDMKNMGITGQKDQKPISVHLQSQSLCEDTLTLNTANEPQISKSNCTTKTKISPVAAK